MNYSRLSSFNENEKLIEEWEVMVQAHQPTQDDKTESRLRVRFLGGETTKVHPLLFSLHGKILYLCNVNTKSHEAQPPTRRHPNNTNPKLKSGTRLLLRTRH